jgi:polyisoprenoid-binding protein YceI
MGKVALARIVAALLFSAVSLCAGQSEGDAPREMDTARSVITLSVYKTGLFSAFAHDHEIRTPIKIGRIDEDKNTVEFTVDARDMRVLDPKASESERSEIQTTMLGPKVLDSEKFPEIRFQSTAIGDAGDDKWNVRGDLTLHGETHSVNVNVVGSNGHYSGMTLVSQKEFGITPISLGGGSIKVKDEVRVEFEIFTK